MRTAELTADIANTIHPSIQVKPDYPSNHQGGMMPLLDMKIWVDEDNIVKYKYYEKDVASKFFIQFWSSHSVHIMHKIPYSYYIAKMKRISTLDQDF